MASESPVLAAASEVLGALIGPSWAAAWESAAVADETLFVNPHHRLVFVAARSLVERGVPPEATMVRDELARLAGGEQVDASTLIDLLAVGVGATSLPARLELLRRHAVERRRADLAYELQKAIAEHRDDQALALIGRLAETAQATGSSVEALRSQLITGVGIRDIVRPAALIADLVDVGSLAAIYGRPGSGKSFVALDWSLCVSTGTWWHGHEVQKGAVLYVVAEGASGMQDRLDAWLDHQRLYDPGQIHWLPLAVNLFDQEAAAALATVAAELRPALIVIDTLARSMAGADENSARDMGVIVNAADDLRRRTGAAVVLVHHTGKADGAGLRGSSALEGAVDTAIEIRSTEDVVELTVAKQKNRADGAKLRLRLLPAGNSCVVVPFDGYQPQENLPPTALAMLATLLEIDTGAGVSTSVWEEASGVPRRSFYRRRKDLLDLDLVANLGSDRQPRYTLTDQGRQEAGCQVPTEVPPSANGGVAVVPTSASSLKAGTGGTDTGTDTNAELFGQEPT